MPSYLMQRREELEREIARQDEAWAEVERQIGALSERGVAISRRVLEELDEAFSMASRAALALHHTVC